METKGFRKYYPYTLEQLIEEELTYYDNLYQATRNAKSRRRGYANLFNRDCRKNLTSESSCVWCGSKERLQVDHIIPVSEGGKNEVSNTQVLCHKCNRKKSNSNG